MKILFALMFSFGVAIGKRCPDEALLKPCYCTEDEDNKSPSVVECDNFDSLGDLQKMFDNSMDYSFDTLVLFECVVPYLNATWFLSKNVKELKIHSLTLIDLIDNTDVTVSSVDTIIIQYTTILRGLRWQQFRVFSQLIFLEIDDVKVKKLGNDFNLNVPASLVHLGIDNANVAALEEGDFEGKTNLERIFMPNNRIKILKNSFFKDQRTKMQGMDFSYNPIEYIPGDLFEGMISLLLVVLEGAYIKTLPKEMSLSHHRIWILNLLENPLVCNCKMSWIPGIRKHLFSTLIGNCTSPPFLKSKPLAELTDQDFEAC